MPSATAEHAIRAIIYLCRQPPGRLVSADEIADGIGAPRNYLSKTLNALVKAGIAISSPGRSGGFAVTQPASALSLDRIVRVFDNPSMQSRCMLGNRACNPTRPCRAHRNWQKIGQAHAEALGRTTVADLIAD